MALTAAEAKALLSNIETLDGLRDLVGQINTVGTGTNTVLYSGYVGSTYSGEIATNFIDSTCSLEPDLISNTNLRLS